MSYAWITVFFFIGWAIGYASGYLVARSNINRQERNDA